MENLTFQNLLNYINSNNVELDEIGNEEAPEDFYELFPSTKVDSTGGYEGGGEYMSITFKCHDFYYELNGNYNSWDSSTWNSIYEVTPVEKMVTVYERVNKK